MEDILEIMRGKYFEEGKRLVLEVIRILKGIQIDSRESIHADELFRIMHTLKGNSAMFGQKEVEKISARMEAIYDLIRKDKIDYSLEILELTMQSVHQIYMMMDTYPSVDRYSKRTQKSLIMKLNKVLGNGNSSEDAESKRRENRMTGLNNLWVSFSSRPLFHMRPEIFRNKSELPLSLNKVLIN